MIEAFRSSDQRHYRPYLRIAADNQRPAWYCWSYETDRGWIEIGGPPHFEMVLMGEFPGDDPWDAPMSLIERHQPAPASSQRSDGR